MDKTICKYTFSGDGIILTKEIKININEWHFKLLQDLMDNGNAQIRGKYCDDNNMPLDEAIRAFHDLLDLEVGYEDNLAWYQTMLTKSQSSLKEMYDYVKSVIEIKELNEGLNNGRRKTLFYRNY